MRRMIFQFWKRKDNSKKGREQHSDSTLKHTANESNFLIEPERKHNWNIVGNIYNYIHDRHLMLHESLEIIDWEENGEKYGKRIGYSFLTMLFAIRFLQDNLINSFYYKIIRAQKSELFNFDKSDTFKNIDMGLSSQYTFGNIERDKSGNSHSKDTILGSLIGKIYYLCILMEVLLIVINVIISYQFLEGYYKKYELFYTKCRPNSNSIIKKKKGDLQRTFLEDSVNLPIWKILYQGLFKRKEIKKKKSENYFSMESEDTYYELRKWVPGRLITSLFTSFPPTSTLFLVVNEYVSFLTIFWLIINAYIINIVIEDKFQNRIRDEAVISQELLNELNVKSDPVKQTQDVKLDTYSYPGGGYVEFIPSNTAPQVKYFKTHDLDGNLNISRYNDETDEFDEVLNQAKTTNEYVHNIVRIPPLEKVFYSDLKKRRG